MFNRGAFLALTLIGSLFTSLLPVTLANAQTNAITQLVPFQGRLHNSEGNVVPDGVYDLTFYIYETATGGEFVWSENHSQVSVIHGYVNVLLGGTESGKFSDKSVDFSTQKYLSISIDAGQEMFPRHQLVPTFHAYDASKLGGIDAADYATDVEVTKIIERVDGDIADVSTVISTLVSDRFEVSDTNKAKHASYADNAGKLDSQLPSYYLDAANLTGTVSDANLPTTISREKLEAATISVRGATKKNKMINETNGYFWDKETGYIVQWGEVNTTGATTVTFPTSFDYVHSGSVTLKLDDGWSGATTVQIGTLSKTEMKIQRSTPLGSGSYDVYWQAFGYKAP